MVQSLDDSAPNSIDRAWAEEAKRRLEAVLEGRVTTIPGDEAFQQVRDSLKR
jgi:hypothetical protein